MITDKYLESFAETSTYLQPNVYFLVLRWRGKNTDHYVIAISAIISFNISVSKTAAENQAKCLLTKVPQISHRLAAALPFFVLATITNCYKITFLSIYGLRSHSHLSIGMTATAIIQYSCFL